MKKLKTSELEKIEGGALSGTMINAVTKAINLLYTLGQSIGSSIRRASTGKRCSA